MSFILDHRSFSQFWYIMTKWNKIKPNTSSHRPSSGTFLLGRLAVLVPTSPAPFPALRTRPFGSTFPIRCFRLPPQRPRPSRGRATPAVQTGGRGRAEQRTQRTSRGPPGVQPPSGPRGSGPGRLWRVSASQMCVAPRPWKRVISHPWGWQVPYLSVSLGRHLLVPLAVHGKFGCSKHTLGKPSLKHSGLWFFLCCATSPGTAKGLLYRYPPVLRLRCTGGFARSLGVQTFLKQWNQ